MRWTQVLALGAAASIAATAACGAPSKDAGTTSGKSTTTDAAAPAASAGLMPDAKGPAPEDPGAKKGGTLTCRTRPSRRAWTRARSSTRTAPPS